MLHSADACDDCASKLHGTLHAQAVRGQERCSLAFKLQAKEVSTFDLPQDPERSFWLRIKEMFALGRRSKGPDRLKPPTSTASPKRPPTSTASPKRPPFCTASMPATVIGTRVFVKTASGTTHTLDMKPTDIVGDIKSKMHTIMGAHLLRCQLLPAHLPRYKVQWDYYLCNYLFQG